MYNRCTGLITLIIMCLLILAGCSADDSERIEGYNIIICRILKISADKWSAVSGDSVACGESGDGAAIESLGLELNHPIEPGGIEFQTHIQSLGWTDWAAGGVLGEAGSGKRIEAVKVRLTGELAESYNIYYRVYVADMGWSPWTSDGDTAGTEGMAKGIQSIELKIISKDSIVPEDTTYELLENTITVPVIDYNVYVQDVGWLSNDGESAGTAGGGRRIEGFNVSIGESRYQGSVVYRTYSQTYGWMDWVSDGTFSGTSGEAKRAEGIQIYLTDELAEYIDIYYRVYLEDYGWLGWAVNGQPAGSKELKRRIESIQIQLKAKGEEAPGETAYASISGSSNAAIDIEYVLDKECERLEAVGKYYVEDTEAFKNRNGENIEVTSENVSAEEIKGYCEKYLYSGLVQIDVSEAEGDINDYCVQELLEYYIDKGTKTIFYTEFIGYTMEDCPVFRCYYSRG